MRVLVPRKVPTGLVVFLVVLAAIGGIAVVLLAVPPEGITVTTQGSPVVGSSLRFVLTVRTTALPASRPSFLSLSGLNGTFEASPSDAASHPWGRANVWNLSGLDLSRGRTFVLDATPVWAAEMVLQAKVWSMVGGFTEIRFVNGDDVAPGNISLVYRTPVAVTVTWPLSALATPDVPFVLGRPTHVRVSIRDGGAGVTIPAPLFLSVVTKSMYYTLAATGASPNPWNATSLWNLTGVDLARGVDVDLTVTAQMTGMGIPMDVIVWSPRGSGSAVSLDADGVIVTRETVRLWVDLTFSFSVSNA